jgi:hypothetical protein
MPQGKLRTPEVQVRELQEKLHRSTKADKHRRFHQLYDKVWSPPQKPFALRAVSSVSLSS